MFLENILFLEKSFKKNYCQKIIIHVFGFREKFSFFKKKKNEKSFLKIRSIIFLEVPKL